MIEFDVTGTLPDGTAYAHHYWAGVLTQALLTDLGNHAAWETIHTHYNGSGHIIDKTVTYDNGVVLTLNYIPWPPYGGALFGATKEDKSDAFGWDTVVTHYDSAGRVTEKTVTWDNGVVLTLDYSHLSLVNAPLYGGALTSATHEDTGDAFAWDTIVTHYNSAGHVTDKTVTWDNGVVLTQTYHSASGALSGATQEDTADAFAWESIVTHYDSAGHVTDKTVTYDTGLVVTQTYSNGALHSATHEDMADAFAWESIVTHYDSAGHVTDKTVTYDTGLVVTQTYSNGALHSATHEDMADAFAWNSMLFCYAADGSVVLTRVTWDDGHMTVTGGDGFQQIVGGAGSDVLTGGAGHDIFYLQPGGNDVITDFTPGEDVIDLHAFGINSMADFTAAGYTASHVGADVVLHMGDQTLTFLDTDRIIGDADFSFSAGGWWW